jgi:hypothetical protein
MKVTRREAMGLALGALAPLEAFQTASQLGPGSGADCMRKAGATITSIAGFSYLGRTTFPNGIYLWNPNQRRIVQRVCGGAAPQDFALALPPERANDIPTQATGMNKSVGLLVAFRTGGLYSYKPWESTTRRWSQCVSGSGGMLACDYSDDDRIYWATPNGVWLGEAHRVASRNAPRDFPDRACFSSIFAPRNGESVLAIAVNLFRKPAQVFVLTSRRALVLDDRGSRVVAERAVNASVLGGQLIARSVGASSYYVGGTAGGMTFGQNRDTFDIVPAGSAASAARRALPSDEERFLDEGARLAGFEPPDFRQVAQAESVYDSLSASFVCPLPGNQVLTVNNEHQKAVWRTTRGVNADSWLDCRIEGGAWTFQLSLEAGHPSPARVRAHPLTPNEIASWAGNAANFFSCSTSRDAQGNYAFRITIEPNRGLARIRGVFLDAPNRLASTHRGTLLALVQAGRDASGCQIVLTGKAVRDLNPRNKWQRAVEYDFQDVCGRKRVTGVIVACGGGDVTPSKMSDTLALMSDAPSLALETPFEPVPDTPSELMPDASTELMPDNQEEVRQVELFASGGPCEIKTTWINSEYDF